MIDQEDRIIKINIEDEYEIIVQSIIRLSVIVSRAPARCA